MWLGPLLDGAATPLFSVARNDVNAVPSARKLSPGPVDQLYVLFTSCTSLGLGVPTVPVFFSQISPVFRSLTVWSQLAR